MTWNAARGLILACTLAVAGVLGHTGTAQAQVALGGQVAWNPDLRNEDTWGVGGRGLVRIPVVGIALLGTLDFYMPDCKGLECGLQEAGANLLWFLPLHLVANPYVGGGVVLQNSEGGWELGDDKELGVSFLAGLYLDGPAFRRFRPFGEARYLFMPGDFPSQLVVSAGILLFPF